MEDAAKKEVQEKEYEEIKKSLEELVKKDKTQGKFEEMRGMVDTRKAPSLIA